MKEDYSLGSFLWYCNIFMIKFQYQVVLMKSSLYRFA